MTPKRAVGGAERDRAPEVQERLRRLRSDWEARDLLAAERAAADFTAPASSFCLVDELQTPTKPLQYRIDQLLTLDGNLVVTAQFKTGKTVLAFNIVRAVADDVPFLGEFKVTAVVGRVAHWNFELSPDTWRRWARSISIDNPDKVCVYHLRGEHLDLGSTVGADHAVDWLRSRNVEVWILDPFSAAYYGKSENDNTEVRAWLRGVERVAKRAEVQQVIILTHTGRAQLDEGAERARGATALDDWPDNRWVYTKDSNGRRFLKVHAGRDVEEQPEFDVSFDPDTQRLCYGDGVNRTQARAVQLLDEAVREVLLAGPDGISSTAVRDALHKSSNLRLEPVLREAARQGLIEGRDLKPRGMKWRAAKHHGEPWGGAS